MISLLTTVSSMFRPRAATVAGALVLLGVGSGCAPSRARPADGSRPPSQDPAVVVRLAVDSVFNLGRLDAADRFFEPAFAAEERLFAQRIRGAFPDLRIELDPVVREGAWVAVRWRATGTHQGDFGDLRATGRRATWTGAWFWRVQDGRIVDGKQFNVWDQFGLRQQLMGAAR